MKLEEELKSALKTVAIGAATGLAGLFFCYSSITTLQKAKERNYAPPPVESRFRGLAPNAQIRAKREEDAMIILGFPLGICFALAGAVYTRLGIEDLYHIYQSRRYIKK